MFLQLVSHTHRTNTLNFFSNPLSIMVQLSSILCVALLAITPVLSRPVYNEYDAYATPSTVLPVSC